MSARQAYAVYGVFLLLVIAAVVATFTIKPFVGLLVLFGGRALVTLVAWAIEAPPR